MRLIAYLLLILSFTFSPFQIYPSDIFSQLEKNFEITPEAIERLVDRVICLREYIVESGDDLDPILVDEFRKKLLPIVYLNHLQIKNEESERLLKETLELFIDEEDEPEFILSRYYPSKDWAFDTSYYQDMQLMYCSGFFKKLYKKSKNFCVENAAPIISFAGTVVATYIGYKISQSYKDPNTPRPTLPPITYHPKSVFEPSQVQSPVTHPAREVKEENKIITQKTHKQAEQESCLIQQSIENKKPLSSYEKNDQENIFYLEGQQALKGQYYDQAIDSFGKAIEINPHDHNIYLDRAYAHLLNEQFDNSLNDYQAYTEQKNKLEKPTTFIDCFDFSRGVTTGITKGAVESGKQLISFAAKAITHPINTGQEVYEAFSNVAKLAYSQEWKTLSQALAPEVCTLVKEWDSLSLKERGEKSGYIVGKYGSDILIPGASAKAIFKGIKGAKELAVITKNLQNTEKVMVLEALAGSGGNAGAFKEIVYKTKTAEQFLSHSSEIFHNLKKSSRINSKTDILNVIKPNGRWTGKSGTSDRIRLFQGGQNEAMQIFKKLSKDGKLVHSTQSLTIYKLSDDTHIIYRSISTSGPPTIDIKLSGTKNHIKLKFLEKK